MEGDIHALSICSSLIFRTVHLGFRFLLSAVLVQVMSNQEAVDIARKMKDPLRAAKSLAAEAVKRDSKDDISYIVVRLKV